LEKSDNEFLSCVQEIDGKVAKASGKYLLNWKVSPSSLAADEPQMGLAVASYAALNCMKWYL